GRLRARIAQLDLAGLEQRLAELETRRSAAGAGRRGVEERLGVLLAERGNAEEELADAAGAREQALQALYRLRSAAERLELRRWAARPLPSCETTRSARSRCSSERVTPASAASSSSSAATRRSSSPGCPLSQRRSCSHRRWRR